MFSKEQFLLLYTDLLILIDMTGLLYYVINFFRLHILPTQTVLSLYCNQAVEGELVGLGFFWSRYIQCFCQKSGNHFFCSNILELNHFRSYLLPKMMLVKVYVF